MIYKYGTLTCFVDKKNSRVAVTSGKIKKEYSYTLLDKSVFVKGFFIIPLDELQSKVFDPLNNREYLLTCDINSIKIRKLGKYILVYGCNTMLVFNFRSHAKLYGFDSIQSISFQPSKSTCTVYTERLGIKQTVCIKQEGLVWN